MNPAPDAKAEPRSSLRQTNGNSDLRRRAEALFQRAAELSLTERAALLDAECASDTTLRDEVAALLHLFDEDDGFLERPAYAGSASLGVPEQFGDFAILRVIGTGGMGVVYEARQNEPRRIVALKVIRPGLMSPSVLGRFHHEANVLAQLQHPGIAQIYQTGTVEVEGSGFSVQGSVTPVPYFAMELVRGRPLNEYADTHALGTREKLELIAKVCDAVQHAHEKGVIHRDLKPANILVQGAVNREQGTDRAGTSLSDPRSPFLDPSSAQPKILDFGVARATNADLQVTTMQTDAGQLIGTIPYMSPEQVIGDSRQVDVRSDVYALGVILYELLTGRLPIDVRNRSIPEAARMIREDEPSRLGSIAGHGILSGSFRGDIQTIVAKALAKEKQQRYGSAAELAADIRHYLRDEPIVARPASTFYHLRKFARRNKGLVIGVAAAFVALTLGLAGMTYSAVKEKAQRQLAEFKTSEANRSAYRANLAAAQAALEKHDVPLARRCLDAAPPELRGWEWDHLNWVSDRRVATHTVDPAHVQRVIASGDERHLVCGGRDGHVRFIDPNDGRTVRSFDTGVGTITGLALSRSGRSLLSGHDGQIHMWELDPDGTSRPDAPASKAGEVWPRLVWSQAAHGWVSADAFSPDGESVAVACDGGRGACLLSAATGERVATFPSDVPGVGSAAISPDGRLLACHGGAWVSVLDLGSGRRLWGADGMFDTPCFTPDGRCLLLIRDWGGFISLRDSTDGRELRVIRGLSARMASFAFSGDAALLAVVEQSGVIVVRDADDFTPAAVIYGSDAQQPSALVRCRDKVVTVHAGGRLNVWELATCAAPYSLMPFGARTVLSPDTRRIAGTSWGDVCVWDTDTGAQQWCRVLTRQDVGAIAFHPDADAVVAARGDGVLTVLDGVDGRIRYETDQLPAEPTSLAWSRHARPHGWIFMGAADGRVYQLDPASLQAVANWEAHAGPVAFTVVSDDVDATRVVVTAAGGARGSSNQPATVRIWEAALGESSGNRQSGHPTRLLHELDVPAAVECIAIADAGRIVLIASRDERVTLWRLESRESITLATAGSAPRALAMSPDGSRLVAGCWNGQIYVWDTQTRDELLVLRSPQDLINDLSFTPDGRTLLSTNQRAALWEFATAPPAGGYAARDMSRRAARAVARQFETQHVADDVVAALERDSELAEPVRTLAVRLARVRGDNPNLLNSAAWGRVKSAQLAEAEYHVALRMAEAACRQWPDIYALLNTLGVAQYRVGDYAGAIATLQRCDAMKRAETGASHPADLAVMAMALHRLGRKDPANAALGSARELLSDGRYQADAESLGLFNEAATLIGVGRH